MIIYNKTWLANLRLQQAIKNDLQAGLITEAEYKTIEQQYPVGFYTPNLFVRIGLFILTCVIVLFADGFLSLLAASSSGVIESFGWWIFLGVLTYIALELIIRNNFHYRSGVDDAFLVIAGGQLVLGIGILLYHNNGDNHYLALSAVIMVISICFVLRFTDILMSAIAALSFLSFIFFGWINGIPAGLSTVPFTMILFSAGMYWLAYRYHLKENCINYSNNLIVVQAIGLLAFYAAGNYYIIQTLSHKMMGASGPVPFGLFFWIWTVAVPFVYIYAGIARKDYVLLRSGLLLVAAAAITFRTYCHLMPVDVSLTIVGALVLAIVYGVTKYLKTPKHGFTSAEPDEMNLMDKLKVESLIAAGTFSHTPVPSANDGVKFGGGSFGGGGSSSDF